MNNQRQVKAFLKDFVDTLTVKYSEDVDFILLFGSAARGEWKRGISDVDMIIQLKTCSKSKEISRYAEALFWKLDKKHDTEFHKVCSMSNKKSLTKQLQRKARLYVPFEVFDPKEVDWKKARINKASIIVGARLVMPQSMMFKKMKVEGEILYGRDIRKVIPTKANPWERIKAIFVPHHLAFFALISSLFTPELSLRMACKSILYSIDATIFFIGKPFKKDLQESTKALEKQLVGKVGRKYHIFNHLETEIYLNYDYRKPIQFDIIKEAIKLKHNWARESAKFNRIETAKFCWKALWFVIKLNWLSVGLVHFLHPSEKL
jgi:predicted nucleotidyltransferase